MSITKVFITVFYNNTQYWIVIIVSIIWLHPDCSPFPYKFPTSLHDLNRVVQTDFNFITPSSLRLSSGSSFSQLCHMWSQSYIENSTKSPNSKREKSEKVSWSMDQSTLFLRRIKDPLPSPKWQENYFLEISLGLN